MSEGFQLGWQMGFVSGILIAYLMLRLNKFKNEKRNKVNK